MVCMTIAAVGPDVESRVEDALGDALPDDVANQLMQGGQDAGVFAGTGLGQMLVVEAQRPVQAVLGAGFGLLAEAVDHQLQRGGAVQAVGLGAPGMCRLRDGPVEQGEQQFVLAAEMLVEGPQRGLGARDDFLDGEVGASGFAQYLHGRLDEAVAARHFSFIAGAGHQRIVPFRRAMAALRE